MNVSIKTLIKRLFKDCSLSHTAQNLSAHLFMSVLLKIVKHCADVKAIIIDCLCRYRRESPCARKVSSAQKLEARSMCVKMRWPTGRIFLRKVWRQSIKFDVNFHEQNISAGQDNFVADAPRDEIWDEPAVEFAYRNNIVRMCSVVSNDRYWWFRVSQNAIFWWVWNLWAPGSWYARIRIWNVSCRSV